MIAHGLMLTKFHHARAKEHEYPHTLLVYIDSGELAVARWGSRYVEFPVPVKWILLHNPRMYGNRKYSIEIGGDEYPEFDTFGMHAKTERGARAVLHRNIVSSSARALGSPVKSVGTPRNEITRMLGLALKLHIQRRSYWSRLWSEVSCFDGYMDFYQVRHWRDTACYEIKSCRSDFTSDKKWRKYMKCAHRFSFVTVPDAIKADELPEGVGLYYLNMRFHTNAPLKCIVAPKHREIDPYALLEPLYRVGLKPYPPIIDELELRVLVKEWLL